MSFHLHTSNRLDRLAEQLAAILRVPQASPFTPETVVVQSLGMSRWLKLELARHLGICAHVAFPFPRAFIDQLFRDLVPDQPDGDLFGRETMQWRLFERLGSLPETATFDGPRRYLEDCDPRKRLQLAARLAHLFDQYLVFRPDLIEKWESGKVLPGGTTAGEPWQSELWRGMTAGSAALHPARRHAELHRRLSELPPPPLPSRVAVFGVSALPPVYVDLFAALAGSVEVHCFLLQPCAEWWGDIVTGRESERTLKRMKRRAGDAAEVHLEPGHRLLGSLGTLGRDFLKLLYEQTQPVETGDFVPPDGDSILNQLQRDLLELTDPVHGSRRPMAPGDDSIRLHVCHSPLRELEVLHDQLLDWFQRDPTLTPRDVLVMAPDLATYSPLVHAVFDAPTDTYPPIPYSLADQGPLQTGGVSETFLNLLRLAKGRFGVTPVLDLLECGAVRRRFGLVEADLAIVRHWVSETRIHWGRDAAHRESLGQPATEIHSWRDGIRRLILGHAMADDGNRLFQGIPPYPDVEGSITGTLGRFAEFVDRLSTAVADLEQRHPPADWIPVLLAIVAGFFELGPDTEDELKQIRQRLDELRRPMLTAGVNEPVDLELLLEPLVAAFEADLQGGGFLTGGVTFCALKPMRSIPFRVICLLGMNDGAFPRPSTHLSLDLMAAKPRLGDRSTRDDDRYLFLETLISARDRLHLSHVGQSQRDNRPIPPSVVVSELLDHLDGAFAIPHARTPISDAALVVRHRLHAFSPAYFTSNPASPLFSYSGEECATASNTLGIRQDPGPFLPEPLSEPDPERRQVTLRQLTDFLCHPAKFLLRERLQIELPRAAETPDDTEPLTLDARDAYDLKQDWVTWAMAGEDPANFGALFAAEGRLAPGRPGVMEFQDLRAVAERFRRRLGEPGPAASVPLQLSLGDFELTGRLAPRPGAGLLHHRCATLKAADLLRIWVEHLAWNLASPNPPDERTSTLVAEDARLDFRAVPEAAMHLQALLDLYWRGLQVPLRFFPRTALALVEAERKAASGESRSKKTPLEAARPVWIGTEHSSSPPEGEDPWFRLCFRHEPDPLTGEFLELARAVFVPLLDHSERGDA